MIDAYWKFRFLVDVFGFTIILMITLAWMGVMAYFYYIQPFMSQIWNKIFGKC